MIAKQRTACADHSHKTIGARALLHSFRRRKSVASLRTTRQTARGLRKALRETLPVIRHARTLIVIAFTAGGLSRIDSVHADSTYVFTGSIGGTSDFVFRGLSLTRGRPAAQASFDVEFPKEFYIGAFIATADPREGLSPDVEFDIWAGRYWRVSENFSADVRLSQYSYPEDPRLVSYNRSEITGTLGFRNQLFFAAIYSPNTHAVGSSAGYAEGSAWAVEISGRHPFNERFSVSAGFGHYGLDEIYHDSYNYWNATLIATLRPFELQLAYLGVDSSAARHFVADSVGDRVALTVLWRFSSTK
jgi:uncharacterized protein (TIGR02001 family)